MHTHTHMHTYSYIHIYIIKQHSKIECAALLSDRATIEAATTTTAQRANESSQVTSPHRIPHLTSRSAHHSTERYTTHSTPAYPTSAELTPPHTTYSTPHQRPPHHIPTSPRRILTSPRFTFIYRSEQQQQQRSDCFNGSSYKMFYKNAFTNSNNNNNATQLLV